jgi:hypothetical protein
MLAEEVEQKLDNTDPDQRWQVTAARDILEHGCLCEEFPSFVTSYGSAPDPGLIFRPPTLLVLLAR